MSAEIAIKVENLSKCYRIYDKPRHRLLQMLARGRKQYGREFWALKDISFEIKKGQTLGIIGRNGSGKSTLLQLICGVLNPSSGSIETHGKIASMLELGAGFNAEFSGRENVYLSAALYGLTREQIDERFERILMFADIGDFIDQPVKTYSSGMFVRLAFAVIAHVDADILVIDEALAVGDAFFVQKCMRFLRNFAKTGTMIFVSHDIGSILNLCNMAIWLQQGKMRGIGSPKALTNEYLQALYEEQNNSGLDVNGKSSVQVNERSGPAKEDTSSMESGENKAKRFHGSLPRDMRQHFINQTTLRNDIEVFTFNSDALGFGVGGASVDSVHFEDANGAPLSWIVGGEEVVVTVTCTTQIDLFSPIIGFVIKDRLGQPLFGDNTYLSSLDRPLKVHAGQRLQARFFFRMPVLPKGDYALSAAIAEGTQASHVQHHWAHDALTFTVHSTHVFTGLVGIPMTNIELTTID